jgi:hypothetical protein
VSYDRSGDASTPSLHTKLTAIDSLGRLSESIVELTTSAHEVVSVEVDASGRSKKGVLDESR